MDNKERILIKAHELYNRYGIRSVSMDDIATQLGISKKTLYQYFVDKDELVNAVIHNIIEQNKSQCLECSKKGDNAIHEVFMSFEMVEEMLATMNASVLFDMQKYHPTAFRKFLDFKNQFLYHLLKENMQKGIKQELYRQEIDVDILAKFRLYSIMLSFDSEVFPSNKSKLLYIEQQLMEHFLYGIASFKGQKLIQKYKERIKIKN